MKPVIAVTTGDPFGVGPEIGLKAAASGPVRDACHRYAGHTELLAELCGFGPDEVAMMFVAPDLKVALQTIHLGLKEAIASLSREAIEARLALVRSEHLRWFGRDPRVGVAALNP